MSDPKAAWLPDWQSMQKQFFSAWTDAARGGVAPSTPVHEGFDVWLKLFGGRDSGNETLERVIGSARQFADFMQGVIGQLATTRPELSSPAALREALEKAFGGIDVHKNPVLDALRSVTGEGAKGFEDLFREWMKVAKPLEADARGLLNLPAFGYSRESQERQQALAQAVLACSDQMNRYNALMYRASRLGLDRFESRLAERSEPGREITSLRGLYDLFVDAAEEGYAEVALSEEFREVYGELVNAQMRVRQLVQGEVERASAALGMPGRTELDSVLKRSNEMRRRIADLEERLQRLESASLASPAPAPAASAAAAEAVAAESAAPARRAPAKPRAARPSAQAAAPKTANRRRRS